ncbi:MAG: hypothetical protein HYT22_00100 [Candidatus Niyogibacteria bacterium]|nr:hypothetical protein [Candidatus Niyogibacteria bacterium]
MNWMRKFFLAFLMATTMAYFGSVMAQAAEEKEIVLSDTSKILPAEADTEIVLWLCDTLGSTKTGFIFSDQAWGTCTQSLVDIKDIVRKRYPAYTIVRIVRERLNSDRFVYFVALKKQ